MRLISDLGRVSNRWSGITTYEMAVVTAVMTGSRCSNSLVAVGCNDGVEDNDGDAFRDGDDGDLDISSDEAWKQPKAGL
jgi:hypothetical protein